MKGAGTEPFWEGSDEQLITTYQLASMLSVSVAILKKARVSGDGGPPFIKLGKRTVRYRLGDVRTWLAAKPMVRSTSELPSG